MLHMVLATGMVEKFNFFMKMLQTLEEKRKKSLFLHGYVEVFFIQLS